ncbi:MAG: hypothetical protein N2Z80_04180 [Hydrogenothermaceae bacterium]|nr:hypothetical protein [Hydrogenothermaceae bacterium]
MRYLTRTVLLSAILTDVFASEFGSSKVYIFKDSIPLKNEKVLIEDKEFRTNEYGEIDLKLKKGIYTIKIGNFSYHLKIEDGEMKIYYIDLTKEGITINQELATGSDTQLQKTPSIKEGEEKKRIKANIRLKVISYVDQKPISGVKVYIKGNSKEYLTDKSGEILLDVEEEKISLSFIHPEYSARTIDDIEVSEGQILNQTVRLTPLTFELSEYVVTAPYIQGTIAEAMAEQAKFAEVVNILSSEQFSKAGDSDASSAVKRVSGITIMDNGHVYIRGLGGRYSITLLNNSILPSPDPIKRIVPLDIFPTGVLNNIVIKKSYSPDIPASFATGTVILNTKDYPKEFFLDVSASVKYNSLTTFKDGKFYEGGKTDFLGFDDGTRKLPFPDKDAYSGEELEKYVTTFRSKNNLKDITFPPGVGFNLALGDSKKFGDGSIKVGYLLSFMYDNEWKKVDVERNIYNLSQSGLTANNGGIYNNNVNDIKLAYLVGTGLSFRDSQIVKFTSLLTRISTNRAQVYNGTDENQNVQRITNLRWQERSLMFNQLFGSHSLPLPNFKLEWATAFSTADMEIPNEVSYTYWLEEGTGRYYNRVRVPNSNLAHEFTYLKDKSKDFRVDIIYKKDSLLLFKDTEIKFGIQQQEKERSSRIRRFTYLPKSGVNLPEETLKYENIDAIFSPENREKYFRIQNRTFFNDKYSGKLDVNAFYANFDTKLGQKVRVSVGNRFEDLKQNVLSYEQLSPTELKSDIKLKDSYPDLSVKYFFSDTLNLKGAYSKTMTYPDFLEVSNSVFIDPLTGERILGNPNLKPSKIDNFDLRIEKMLAGLDSVSISLFYRNIKNPIEETYLPTTNNPFLSYQNALKANNYGAEFEFRKSFNFINKIEAVEKIPYLGNIDYDNFFISGNVAFIESKVTLDEESAKILTSKSRRMQGQSPYVLNLTFGYDNPDTGLYWGMLYNTFGKRIRSIGLYGQPDHYEQSFDQLDFVFKKKLKKNFTIDFKAKNILDDEVLVLQGDKVSLRYKVGRSFSFGISYKF